MIQNLKVALQGVWAAWFSAHSAQSLLGKLNNLPEWKQEDPD